MMSGSLITSLYINHCPNKRITNFIGTVIYDLADIEAKRHPN